MNRETDSSAGLKALQDEIYRDKVLRARAMTCEERINEAFELTAEVFQNMHTGAMWQLKTSDSEAGWQEVARRLERLRQVHEAGCYVSQKPEAV